MAKEKKEEKKEEEEGKEGEAKKSKLPIIIVAVVLVVLIGAGVGLFFMLKAPVEEPAAEGAAGVAKEHAVKKEDKKKSAHGEEGKIGPIFTLDTIVVNLISEGGARFAKVGVGLEMDAHELGPEIALKKAVFNDIVISVLASRTAEEIATVKGKEAVKQDIMDKINGKLVDGRVKNVYFTAFIIQ